MALYNASKLMPDTIGGNILRVALQQPLRQIITNAGQNPDVIIEQLG
jgi:chaperonin GroEL (HSP60 family)